MAAPPGRQIEALLEEALAKYRAHPSDYLEGVVTGLMRMPAREPDSSWCDMVAQDRNAGSRPATTRLRDYLNGTSAPIQFVFAEDPPPTQGSQW